MKQIFTLILLLLNVIGYSQNLVSNPGFETKRDPNFCPTWATASMNPFPAANWSSIESPDYYHTCATEARVNPNLNEQTVRNGGNAYSGFVAFLRSHLNKSEYSYQTLSAPLQKGRPYYIEFWVSLKDDSGYSVRTLGMYLTNNLSEITNSTYTARHSLPAQIKNTSVFYDNKSGWTKISGSYTPTVDGVQYFAIGNFDSSISYSSPNAKVLSNGATSGEPSVTAYYFVDDIVIKEDCPTGIYAISGPTSVMTNTLNGPYYVEEVPYATNYQWSIYPNPENFTISGQGNSGIYIANTALSGGYSLTVNVTVPCGNPLTGEYSFAVTGPTGGGGGGSGGGEEESFVLYPNPSKDRVTIEFPNKKEKASIKHIKIYDAYGNLKKSAKTNDNIAIVKVEDLQEGIYYLHIFDGKKTQKQQMSISR